MAYKPRGYADVSPYLIVDDVAGVIAFMKKGLGGKELRRFKRPDGSIMHAEVQLGDSVVMIGGGNPDWPNQPCHVHVYVKDVEKTFAKAVKAGGKVIQELKQENDPDKRGGVADASGTTWWVSTSVGMPKAAKKKARKKVAKPSRRG